MPAPVLAFEFATSDDDDELRRRLREATLPGSLALSVAQLDQRQAGAEAARL